MRTNRVSHFNVKLIPMFLLAGLISSCGNKISRNDQASTSKDIGAHFSGSYVYYLESEGEVLVRAECPNDVVFVNRVNCDRGPVRVLAWMFIADMDARYWEYVKQDEKRRNQYVLLVSDLDDKILLLLQDAPQQNQSLLPQIKSKEQALIDIESIVVSLADQVMRIEEQLRHEDHPDLRRLLLERRTQFTEQQNLRAQTQKELNELRHAHLDNNSGILTTDNFQRLIRQRDSAIRDLKSAEFSLKKSIDFLGDEMTAMKFLKDNEIWAFSYRDSATDNVSKVVNDFYEVFSPLKWDQFELKVRDNSNFFRIGRADVAASELFLRNKNPDNCSGFTIRSKNFPDILIKENNVTYDNDNHPVELNPLFSESIGGFVEVLPRCQGSYDLNDIIGRIKVTSR